MTTKPEVPRNYFVIVSARMVVTLVGGGGGEGGSKKIWRLYSLFVSQA